MKNLWVLIGFGLLLGSCGQATEQEETDTSADSTVVSIDTTTFRYPGEKHLANIRRLTWGGDNAEAYWSFDQQMLVFQSNYSQWDVKCDQIFYLDLNKEIDSMYRPPMISTGLGRTTCSYFMPGDTSVVYASTHLGDEACPPMPEPRQDNAYVWPIYEDFDIFVTNLKGEIIDTLTNQAGYDAEATVSPKGDKIVFTSTRSGDLELYTMNLDGSDVQQVTDELGYDGGAFFSPDGEWLVFRSSRPQTEEEIAEYKDLLSKGLVKPTNMEIYVCRVDGSEKKKVTSLGQANWAPFFHPSGEKIIFSSNHASKRGFPFHLYMINVDGTGLEQITSDDAFDAFPMFSPDGKKLVFSSNRFNGGTRSTNLFIADWIE
jgi:TolB protein